MGKKQLAAQPSVQFGRYADCYRTAEQEAAFDAALKDFAKENYLSAYVSFFNYLLDESSQNLRAWEEKGELRFEFFQGSKRVTGFANLNKFYAEAKVAKANSLQPNFMRRLLDTNFDLKYSRFALTPNNEIVIVFDTNISDGSPYKLYEALRELAIRADKHDDILVDEFEALEIADFNVKRALPDAEKKIKYQFIQQSIKATIEELDNEAVSADQFAVAHTYLLLDLCYKLDYLTKPEGYMMETLERIHRLAFTEDGKNAAQKNQDLRREFQDLLDRPAEKFYREMYEVSTTFGITPPADHQKLSLLIDQELPNMQWYANNGYERIAMAIPSYIVGQALFSYALPPPDRDLFHLFMQVTAADFFQQLGFKPLVAKAVFDEKGIKNLVRDIKNLHEREYPNLNPDTKSLVFADMPSFAESFLLMVQKLDLSKT